MCQQKVCKCKMPYGLVFLSAVVVGAILLWRLVASSITEILAIALGVVYVLATVLVLVIVRAVRSDSFAIAYVGHPEEQHTIEHKAEVISITTKKPLELEGGNRVVGYSQLLQLDPEEIIER